MLDDQQLCNQAQSSQETSEIDSSLIMKPRHGNRPHPASIRVNTKAKCGLILTVLALGVFFQLSSAASEIAAEEPKLNSNSEWPETPAWSKKPLTNEEIQAVLLDRMAMKIRACERAYIWSDSHVSYTFQPNQKVPVFEAFAPWGEIPVFMLLVALDGTDQQIKLTGIDRSELKRRALLAVKTVPKFMFPERNATVMVKLINARVKAGNWKTLPPQERPLAAKDPKPSSQAKNSAKTPPTKPKDQLKEKKVSLGYHANIVHKKRAQNLLTIFTVPQDYADPRKIGGSVIREWMQSKGQPAMLAPDFTCKNKQKLISVFDVFTRSWFSGYSWEACGLRINVLTPLLRSKGISARFRSLNGHIDELTNLYNRITTNTGHVIPIHGPHFDDPIFPLPSNAYMAGVHGSAYAQAFTARIAQAERIYHHPPLEGRTTMCWPRNDFYNSDNTIHSYLLLKLCPPVKNPISFKKAAQTVEGSFWSPYVRLAIHRTPDKIITHVFNQGSSKNSRRDQFKATQGRRASTITPVNDTYLPKKANPNFVLGYESAFGHWNRTKSSGSETEVRNTLGDGVMSTWTRINHFNERKFEHRATQYQSYTSFYGKTCISLVRILPAKGVKETGQWRAAFSSSFYVEPLQAEPRDIYHQGGKLDFKKIAAQFIRGSKLNSFRLGGKYSKSRTVIDSPWWCLNGRVAVAIVGSEGKFISELHKTPIPTPMTYHGADGNAVKINWYQNAAKGDILIDTAALYFTDTPPEMVAKLRTKAQILDTQLPVGWKGLISGTPDGQRVLAIARLYGSETQAQLKLSFPEGAPVFESPTFIEERTGTTTITLKDPASSGQPLVFYVSGGVKQARQIGGVAVELRGQGTGTLCYLSRASANTVYINGEKQTVSKETLRKGIDIPLKKGQPMLVQIKNDVDDDHTGPAVRILSPKYRTEFKLALPPSPTGKPEKSTQAEAWTVNVVARDRSGIKSLKLFLDWKLVGQIEATRFQTAFQFKIDQQSCPPGIHALHAVAEDHFGNEAKSSSIPFRVVKD